MCNLERCWTLTPAWQSPSTPRFGRRVMEDSGVLEKVWDVERETERIVPVSFERVGDVAEEWGFPSIR